MIFENEYLKVICDVHRHVYVNNAVKFSFFSVSIFQTSSRHYLTFSGVYYVIKRNLFGVLERSRFHRVEMPEAIELCCTVFK